MANGMRLGELLVQRGILTQTQLDQALREQQVTREFLGALLVRKKWAAVEEVLAALAEQFGTRYVQLDREPIDWTAARRFLSPAMIEHDCVVIRMDAQSVTVAVANPLDPWAISELERMIGFRKTELVVASPAAIRAANQHCAQQARQAPGAKG